MAAGTCAICGAGTDAGDRYCPACGSDLDATVVEIARSGESPSAGARPAGRPPIGAIGAAVILAAAALWFLSASPPPERDTTPAPDTTAPPAATAAPDTSSPATATTTPQAAPTPTAGPDAAAPAFATRGPTELTSADPVDPTLLPDLAASHVAVVGGTALHLLDLRTGMWTGRRLQNTPSAVHGVDGGVVLAGLVGGRLAFAPADGGRPVALGGSGSELLRVDSDGVVVRRWSAGPPQIMDIALDGRVRRRVATPPDSVPPTVTAATDAAGPAVTIEGEMLVFRSDDGSVAATVASPVRHGTARVALVPAGDDP